MMGYETHEKTNLYATREDMESLVIDEPSSGSFRSFSDPLTSSPPFAQIPADDDPLLFSSSSLIQPHPESRNPIFPFNSILEPPSYAEAVFRSFDGDSHGGEINGHNSSVGSPSSSSRTCSSEYLRISVSDPQKEQEPSSSLVSGGYTYFTYLIMTRTNLPEFGGSEFSVRRRFKEVVALSDQLSEAYRGLFIPLRPDKNVVESQVMQRQEFVVQRRMALEKYLRRLAAHPVVKRSEELRLFLTAQDKLFGDSVAGAVGSEEVAQQAKGGRDLLRIFREFKQSVANDWGGTKPSVVEEDKEFLEKKERLHDFEQQLSNVSQQAESLVKAQQEIAETMGELGLAFVKLTKFENEETVYSSQRTRAADMRNVATAAVKASRLYRELNSQTVKHLDKLHEYLGIILAVNNAFSDRSNSLLTVQTLLSELSSLNSRIEKLEAASFNIFGGDRSRFRKIEELKETIRVTEKAKNSAVREYERIKENNKNELERLDKERSDDFICMLKGFVLNQAGYADKMFNVWELVSEETIGYARGGG